MAKLVDALVSGTSVRKYVKVRVLFWAQLDIRDTKDEIRNFVNHISNFKFHLPRWQGRAKRTEQSELMSKANKLPGG